MSRAENFFTVLLFALLLGDTCRTRLDVQDLQARVDALEGRP